MQAMLGFCVGTSTKLIATEWTRCITHYQIEKRIMQNCSQASRCVRIHGAIYVLQQSLSLYVRSAQCLYSTLFARLFIRYCRKINTLKVLHLSESCKIGTMNCINQLNILFAIVDGRDEPNSNRNSGILLHEKLLHCHLKLIDV